MIRRGGLHDAASESYLIYHADTPCFPSSPYSRIRHNGWSGERTVTSDAADGPGDACGGGGGRTEEADRHKARESGELAPRVETGSPKPD